MCPDYALPPVDETAVQIYNSSISNEGNKRSELKVQLMWWCSRNINLVQVFNGHNVGHVLVVGNYFIVAEEAMAITWHIFQNVVVNIFYFLVCWC